MSSRTATLRALTYSINMMETHDILTISCNDYFITMLKEARELIRKRPEIVLCKDCMKRDKSACPCSSTGDQYLDWTPDDDWFCADGEAKT